MSYSAKLRQPLILLAVGVVSISVSALIAHRALVETTPLMLAAWRMGLASLFFLIVQAARKAPTPAPALASSERWRLALGGLVLAVHFVVWFASLTMTTVSIATLLVCTTPLWTAVGQIALRREKAGGEFWAAFAIALAGIALVIHPAIGATRATPAQIGGDLLALLGGAVFAVYLLAIDGLQHHASSRIVAWTYTIAAVLLWIAAFCVDKPTLRYSLPVWEAIVLLTIVPQIVGHTLINNALRHFRAHIVAFSILAEPVIAAALAVVLLHDIVTPVMILGGVLVLASLAFVLARSNRAVSVQEVSEI